jgi:hypothetical protein
MESAHNVTIHHPHSPFGERSNELKIAYNFSVTVAYLSNLRKDLFCITQTFFSALPSPETRFQFEFERMVSAIFANLPSLLGVYPHSEQFLCCLGSLYSQYTLLMSISPIRNVAAACLILVLLAPPSSFAWGNEGHRMINRLAASSLPADVPAFLRSEAAIQEIDYLGPEPDRWRNHAESELVAAQAPEHFIDLELADALGPLPRKRLDFEATVFAHGERPEKVGLQPWQTLEVWERLKAALREYRHLTADQASGKPANPADIQAVQQVAIFYAGWLGHYVGDGSQPLHTSINYDGWTAKENPHEFSNAHGIHWRFEGTFVAAANLPDAEVAAKMTAPKAISGDIFDSYVAYLRNSATHVDEVYTLDKAGAFEKTGTPASREFTASRLAAGASELRDLIYTAWLESAKPAPNPY